MSKDHNLSYILEYNLFRLFNCKYVHKIYLTLP